GVGAQEARSKEIAVEHAVGLDHAQAAIELHHLGQARRRADEMLQSARQPGRRRFFLWEAEYDLTPIRIAHRNRTVAEQRILESLAFPRFDLKSEIRHCAGFSLADQQASLRSGH